MASPACPSRRELADYALGKLPDERSDVIGSHVSTCAACRETLLACGEETDSLLAALRRPRVEDPYVDEPACRKAMALVEAIGREPSFVGTKVAEPEDVPDLGKLGQYKLLAKLGEGGMGAVYEALHTRLKKVVAVKVLPRERTKDPNAVARFEREMQAVGQLEHANIVRAMDANEEDGSHYLVMEHIKGTDLSDLVQRLGTVSVPDACELIRQAAIGLQYAHEHGLVHRDIKPSNLMLTAEGQVKILDLGLALLSGQHAEGLQELTGSSQMMGTLDYMAPEQGDDSHTVDIRADIYALGATMHKLLCGEAPFGGEKYNTPVKKLMALATEPVPSIRERCPGVPEELATLIDRMTAKDPSERPSTPGEVGAALGPFVTGCDLPALLTAASGEASEAAASSLPSVSTDEHVSLAMTGTTTCRPAELKKPVRAKILDHTQTLQRNLAPLGQRLRRHPVLVAIGAGLAAVLLLGIVMSFTGRHGELLVETDDPNVQVSVKQGGEEVAIADANSGWEIRLKSGQYQVELRGGQGRLLLDRDTITVKPGEKARVAVTLKRPGKSLPDPRRFRPEREAPDKRFITIKPEPWVLPPRAPLSTMALVPEPASIEGIRSWTLETIGHRGPVYSLAYSPEGRFLATACGDGVIRVWDLPTEKMVRALFGHGGAVKSITWSPDGKYLASGSDDRTIRYWDPHTGRLLRTITGHESEILSVAWSPDGRQLASASADATVRIWDPPSRKAVRILDGCQDAAMTVVWSPDGKQIASGSKDKSIRVWDAASGQPCITIRAARVDALAWSPDGTMLAAGSRDLLDLKRVSLWDSTTGELIGGIGSKHDPGKALAWSKDGKKLAITGTGTGGPSAYIWDMDTSRESYRFYTVCRPHGNGLAVAWGPDDRTLAVADTKGDLSIRVTRKDGDVVDVVPGPYGHTPVTLGLAFSPDASKLARVTDAGTYRVWDTDSGALWRSYHAVDHPRGVLAWSPDGESLAIVHGAVRLWHVASAPSDTEELRDIFGYELDGSIAWSRDGQLSVVPVGRGPYGKNILWNVQSRKPLRDLPMGRCNAFSPAGKLLAVDTRIFDLQSGTLVQDLSGLAGKCRCVAWSPDGSMFAAGGKDGNVVVWVVDGGQTIAVLQAGHETAVDCLRWQEQQTLVSGSAGRICTWDVVSGKLLRKVECDGRHISPDCRVAVTSDNSTIQFRGADDGRLLHTILSLREDQCALLSPDGHYRCQPRVQREIVHVVLTDRGEQVTLSPEQFAQRYGWNNDPSRAGPEDPTEKPLP